MESKVEAVLAGKKSNFAADDGEEEGAMAVASSSAFPAAIIFTFLAPPLSLLRHVACLCAGYLGLDGGLKKPSVPAPAPASSSSSSSSAAAAASQRDEVEAAASEECTEVVLEVRSRGFMPPMQTSNTPRESRIAALGGVHH